MAPASRGALAPSCWTAPGHTSHAGRAEYRFAAPHTRNCRPGPDPGPTRGTANRSAKSPPAGRRVGSCLRRNDESGCGGATSKQVYKSRPPGRDPEATCTISPDRPGSESHAGHDDRRFMATLTPPATAAPDLIRGPLAARQTAAQSPHPLDGEWVPAFAGTTKVDVVEQRQNMSTSPGPRAGTPGPLAPSCQTSPGPVSGAGQKRFLTISPHSSAAMPGPVISRRSFLRMTVAKSWKFCASTTKAPVPPMTLRS